MQPNKTLFTVQMMHADGATTVFYTEDEPDAQSIIEGWQYQVLTQRSLEHGQRTVYSDC